MNKENELQWEESESLTPEQRARISHNLRAAKALLARKRPRLSLSSSLPLPKTPNDVESVGRVRLPLNKLDTNVELGGFTVSSLSSAKRSCLSSVETSCNSTSIAIARGIHARPSNNTIISTLLDDDFDQSILDEIDSLYQRTCLRKSAKEVDTDTNGPETTEDDQTESKPNNNNWDNHNTCEHIHNQLPNSQHDGGNVDVSAYQHGNVGEEEESVNMDMEGGYSKYMESLNEDQLEAASTHPSTPLIVVAGPGSGKTSTMVGRLLMLLHQGFGPSHILAMTFTTAAASEMRDRIGAVTGKEIAKQLTISTFHSFSLQLCRAHADKLERTSEFLIYGHGQQRRAVVEAVRLWEGQKGNQSHGSLSDVKVESFKDKSQKWQKFVAKAKASGKTPEECRQKGDEVGAAVLKNYNEILKSCNALDYHDLISCSVRLLTEYPEVFEECQASWKAVIVDEFQDTSAMQYGLLRLLASHGRITIVGDDDQSIFSFNGADISGFDSFRKDFPNYKEVRLKKNYRSTRCIVEAAGCLIRHNKKRCQLKQVLTDNCSGAKITLKECRNEDAQCSFVVDKIFEAISSSDIKFSFRNIAVLYRRQVTGRIFQAAFRDRKIPFNAHGVAFYRKKVIKAIMAMLKTTLPGCDDGPFRAVFKTLLPYEKEERKRVIEHIDKVSTVRKCSFISAASDIFNAKISGTFNRSELSQGRKVLLTLEMIEKLVNKEQSLSSVITSIGKLLPQKYLLEKQAVLNCDGGKLLNEDNDLRSVLEYLLDDVTDFLSSQFAPRQTELDGMENKGCVDVLKAFVDYISEREKGNFRCRRHNNEDSVTLTTIHQSKGLEWDIVFIVKANESEIPLLHEHNGSIMEGKTSIEEERRLLYVAMTRARLKLYILYVIMDSNWQVLRPSRFLQEIPAYLLELQGDMNVIEKKEQLPRFQSEVSELGLDSDLLAKKTDETSENFDEGWDGNIFLRRFNVDDRGIISRIFHQWAKKKAFQNPKRLLDKVQFVVDERLRCKKSNKSALAALKSSLKSDDAFQFAEKVIRWEQIPLEDRAHLQREKQEHFQKLRVETAMSASGPTSKQISYLHKLGCTVVPESKLHASHLIEQYRSL